MELTKEQMQADINFLLNRSMSAGSCTFNGSRDTGASSNSIVAIAYDLIALDRQVMPSDQSDLQACHNMWKKLPEHRKIGPVNLAMLRANEALKAKGYKGTPGADGEILMISERPT